MTIRKFAAICAFGLLPPAAAGAEPGVAPDAVSFGQVAAFAEASAAGGVDGRRLELLTAEDGYRPNASMLEGGGVTLGYGPGDNRRLDPVYPTRIDASGGFAPVQGPSA